MTRKKSDNILALAPLSPDLNASGNLSLAPWSSRRKRTREEQRLVEEAYKRQLAMDIKATEARFAATKIAEIHRHAVKTFDQTSGFILEVKDQPDRSPQHQAYMDQFGERLVQLFAQQLLATVDVGATSIAIEVHASPYPEPEPEPERRVGLFRRLLGD